MSKLKFLPPEGPIHPPHDELSPDESQALAEVRRFEHTNLKDIIWVGVVLVIIFVVSLVYQGNRDGDRQARARAEAQINAAAAASIPPPTYGGPPRYPSAGEIEAEASVREARALVAANSAENAADPLLNPKAPGVSTPSYALPSPKPFSDPNYTGGLPSAQQALAADSPRQVRRAAGPPR